MNCIVLVLNPDWDRQSSQFVLEYNFTSIHGMSSRFDCFACSGRVNILEPAVSYTLTLLLAVFLLRLPSCQILTSMSDWKSWNTDLFKVEISFITELDLIHHLSDLTLQIIFDAWWASMIDGSKHTIAWNTSWQERLWRFYWHPGIKETGSPGIMDIIRHQVLRNPSVQGTSFSRKHSLH